MHVRGTRRTGRAAGVHGKRAGGVRCARCMRGRAGRTAGMRGRTGTGLCARLDARARAATGALFTGDHVLHPK
ncbi:hypothetical protein CRG98_022759 [Punica granatum]|nr:hypothetical protein CRG98_022759 [Punica granatum]